VRAINRTQKKIDRVKKHIIRCVRAKKHTKKKIDRICKEKDDVCEKIKYFLKWYNCTRRPACW
jgi:hypothetical protein